MLNILMHGCNGAMGRAISKLLLDSEDISIAAGVDINKESKFSYPVYNDINEVKEKVDAIIDFSTPRAINAVLEYAKSKTLPLVICTTGFSDEDIKNIHIASKEIPVLLSANMSIGINLLLKLIDIATKALALEKFDMEIVEKHHRNKLDAPSGTALLLADALNKALESKYDYRFTRHDVREKRRDNEIGISSVRGGTIVGEHDIIYAGEDEVITISHTAYSKKIFAKGAIFAAKELIKKKNGLYSMEDIL